VYIVFDGRLDLPGRVLFPWPPLGGIPVNPFGGPPLGGIPVPSCGPFGRPPLGGIPVKPFGGPLLPPAVLFPDGLDPGSRFGPKTCPPFETAGADKTIAARTN
jgi:hypothetical protein